MAYDTAVSRRAFLATSGATLVSTSAAAVPLVLADTGRDAELLRLDREHNAAFAYVRTLEVEDIEENEFEAACRASDDLEFAIHRIPACTLAGLAVKARIAAEYAEPADAECPLLDDIMDSLITDILRIANATPKKFLCSRTPAREGEFDGTI